MTGPIYLDGLSTTPLAPEARDAMLAAWAEPGNPGSPHAAGERAAARIETGRRAIAELIGASPTELVFTSGATEADNLAITGVALAAMANGDPRRHVVVSAIEHKAVLEAALRLRDLGFAVDLAPVDGKGRIDVAALARLVGPHTLLVSVMSANNETGVVQPVADAATLAHAAGALLHCDAAQTVGKIPVDVHDLEVDYLSVSSHKMHGPMGVGALYVAAGALRPVALTIGGGQEGGLRAGTEPAPLVAGFGVAASLAGRRLEQDARHSADLLALFLSELTARQMRFSVNGGEVERLPGAASVALGQIDAQSLALSLAKEVMISTGSACMSGQLDASHVLHAMGLAADTRAETFRVYFGRHSTERDAMLAAELIASRARSLA